MNQRCDIMIEEIKNKVKINEKINLTKIIGSCALDIISGNRIILFKLNNTDLT
jgi:hypothetical protein